MTSIFLDTGAAILGRHLDQFVSRRRQLSFEARVRAALAELGLQVPKFEVRLKQLYKDVCATCYMQGKDSANPHALAIEFFLRLVIEFKGVLVGSIRVIRSWHVKNKVDAELAGNSINQVKRFLVDQLKDLDLPQSAKLATEIQILEL
jgi:hypothetical protein